MLFVSSLSLLCIVFYPMSLSFVHDNFVPIFVAITLCTTSRCLLLFVSHSSMSAVQSFFFLIAQENKKQVLLADPGILHVIHCKDILMSLPKRDELTMRILGYSRYLLILRMVTGIQLINGF